MARGEALSERGTDGASHSKIERKRMNGFESVFTCQRLKNENSEPTASIAVALVG